MLACRAPSEQDLRQDLDTHILKAYLSISAAHRFCRCMLGSMSYSCSLRASSRGGEHGVGDCDVQRRLRAIAAWGLDDPCTASSAAVARQVAADDTNSAPAHYAGPGRLQFMAVWGRLRRCSPGCRRSVADEGVRRAEGG